MISVLVMTDGRDECLAATMESAQEMLQGPITSWVIHDDSGDDAHRRMLADTYPDAMVIGKGDRRGFGGAIGYAWRWLATGSVFRFVFHLEDDFVFLRPVDLVGMCRVLDSHPYLAQLALRRQPWNAEEAAAGGVVESHPDDYVEVTDGPAVWLEHRRFFTTNPSLYRRQLLVDRRWPRGAESEGRFSLQLFTDPEVRCGFWGARDSGEAVSHIGTVRNGVGY